MPLPLQRREFLHRLGQFGLGISLSFGLGNCTASQSVPQNGNASPSDTRLIRIGHQPLGAFLMLREQGTLEQRLAPEGITVQWVEFAAGLPILEAMGAGSIDIGTGGVVPPVIAQAKGISFVYVANETPVPESLGIIVPQESPIRALADLKGKRIAATKGSASHYLLMRALIKGGLAIDDVNFVSLPPPDGKTAFERGEVDALAIWQPFLAQLQQTMPIRFLTTADGLMNDRNFYFATRRFAEDHPDWLRIVIEETHEVGMWAMANPNEAAQILTTKTGLTAELARVVTRARRYDVQPLQDRAIEEQQRIAETFFRLDLLPQRIWVEDAVWKQGLRN